MTEASDTKTKRATPGRPPVADGEETTRHTQALSATEVEGLGEAADRRGFWRKVPEQNQMAPVLSRAVRVAIDEFLAREACATEAEMQALASVEWFARLAADEGGQG